jgi:hypothetical protein
MLIHAYSVFGPCKCGKGSDIDTCPQPIFFLRAKLQDANSKNVTRDRGEIRMLTTKKMKETVLKHFGNTSLTLQIFR